MRDRIPENQLARPGGNHPVSIAVWTPEKNNYEGLAAARDIQRVSGGTIFVSETSPGYVVWFDRTYTATEIFLHKTTWNHSGTLNPVDDVSVSERQCGQVQTESRSRMRPR